MIRINTDRIYLVVSLVLLAWGCSGGQPENNAPATEVVSVEEAQEQADTDSDTLIYEIRTLQEALDLADSLKYTPEQWQAGIREVPRLNWMRIPERWRTNTSREIEVKLKKQIFFRVLAPLALESNEAIKTSREKLLALEEKSEGEWTTEEREWLQHLAGQYKVASDDLSTAIAELKNRVDELPLSLVLAQSAEESGWGTSRFAAEGNALFGQWAWGKDAMKPKEQREGMGDYGLRKFDTPLASMEAYMLNLNTHNAYSELRERRAQLHANDEPVTGPALAATLTRYSERGAEYVETLMSIIRVNHLAQADEAYLSDGPVILVMPVEQQ